MIRLDSSAMKLWGGKPQIVGGRVSLARWSMRRTRSISDIAKYVNNQGAATRSLLLVI